VGRCNSIRVSKEKRKKAKRPRTYDLKRAKPYAAAKLSLAELYGRRAVNAGTFQYTSEMR
jgi:hypothetical protein